MMLRVAAEMSNSENDPIFIDRDGERFVYVLDYMRDGNVTLPIYISKGSFLSDLQYYGLEVRDSKSILIGSRTCVSELLFCTKNHNAHIDRLSFGKECRMLAKQSVDKILSKHRSVTCISQRSSRTDCGRQKQYHCFEKFLRSMVYKSCTSNKMVDIGQAPLEQRFCE
jgi:BTB/POZ domain